LARADFFTCPGERQRNYFYGWLALAGFDLRQIPIAVVPFSLSPELPNHEYPDELQFVYGGVFLPWQNPGVGLRILLEELEAAGQGRLHFFGGKHPCLFMPEKTFEGVQALLQSSRRATVLAAVPRTELLERYCRASAAWDLMPHNCERGMAITSRTIEYLWTGLPVVYNNYAELAESIRDYDAGWLVDPDDEGAIRATARAVLADPDAVRRKGQNAQRLVRERFTWTKAVEPLDHFIRHPTPPRRFADRPFLVPGIGRFPGGLSYLIQRIEVRLRRFPRAHCFLSRIAKSGIDCWRKQRKG
jgi:glycosyltransferase involved in cell wall biosynthesis